jgi:hypothetical protein
MQQPPSQVQLAEEARAVQNAGVSTGPAEEQGPHNEDGD